MTNFLGKNASGNYCVLSCTRPLIFKVKTKINVKFYEKNKKLKTIFLSVLAHFTTF